jgi:2-keto-myo-inositol isomerase
MATKISFALNHMAAPGLGSRAFIDLAATLGCTGVELRNDLADKNLTDRPFFDGEEPSAIGDYCRSRGLRLLGLSEVYGFNRWTPATGEKVSLLVSQAKASGAESISLIPYNDGMPIREEERLENLQTALGEILPMLEHDDMTALVEPLGFTTSSLRQKAEAVEAIKAVGGTDHFKLVHDTFHHYLAGGGPIFPEQTGIVHISGVVDPAPTPEEMQDGDRILVGEGDRLGNVEQIAELCAGGYVGAFSFEPFAASVHATENIATALRASMDYIRSRV